MELNELELKQMWKWTEEQFQILVEAFNKGAM